MDSTGFELPTAIAFVSNPGDGPDDPAYFVTQLHGEVMVVTNDRSIRTFATVPTIGTQRADLAGASQQGLAGICLDAANGYVFVTFTHPDEGGILRNHIVRFSTTPETFGLTPTAVDDFSAIFAEFQSAPAHQIGGCSVHGQSLFVGIGDGGNPAVVKDPDVLLGKLVCLTVDGDPCPDNPFLSDDLEPEALRAADYTWAYGFRNPFGIAIVDDGVYLAENGIQIDRFLKARRGGDHHWDGSDQSIAMGAKVVFPEPLAPVQLDFLPTDGGIFPAEYRDSFFFAAFGGEPHLTGVVYFPYDFQAEEVIGPPAHLLTYRGEREQRVIGLAFGLDGLYVAPSLPDAEGNTSILRVTYDPDNAHPVVIGAAGDPLADSRLGLLAEYSCLSCHAVDGQGGGIGPSLDRFGLNWRLTERLNSPAYEAQVAEVDQLNEEPFASYREERQEVLEARGRERTRVWIKHFLLEPRFDNPEAQMPNPGLTEAEATLIRDELFGAQTLRSQVVDAVRRSPRTAAVGFALGVGASALLALVIAAGFLGVRWLRRRKETENSDGT